MGKSKARIFRKGKNDLMPKISRDDAIAFAVENLEKAEITEAKRYITMFCLSAEELLESGASYETVVAIKNIFT